MHWSGMTLLPKSLQKSLDETTDIQYIVIHHGLKAFPLQSCVFSLQKFTRLSSFSSNQFLPHRAALLVLDWSVGEGGWALNVVNVLPWPTCENNAFFQMMEACVSVRLEGCRYSVSSYVMLPHRCPYNVTACFQLSLTKSLTLATFELCSLLSKFSWCFLVFWWPWVLMVPVNLLL